MGLLIWLMLSIVLHCSHAYKPVVLVHGIFSDAQALSDLKILIKSHHPTTKVIRLKYEPELYSTVRLPIQLSNFKKKMKIIMAMYPGGYHMICHSQGGLLCLGFVETTPNHNVHSFIVLSSPLFGQYGIPQKIFDYVPILSPLKYLETEAISTVMYTSLFQKELSVANYWRDPRASEQKEYEKSSIYLPITLNDPKSIYYHKKAAQQRKRNFLKLKKLVLIGGPNDGVITPWQSTLFGYFDENYETIIPMKKQKVFLEDWFGLKTLYHSGRLSTYVFPGVKHTKWHSNPIVFKKAVEPSLT